MRRALYLSLSVLALACAWWIAHTIRHPKLGYFDDSVGGIEARAELVPPGGVLVIGDSIAARNYLPTLCGLPALNASIGWSTTHDWVSHVPKLIKAAKPSIVILAVGNNDTRSDWQSDYRQLAKVATFAVTPKQPDKAAFIHSLLPTVPVPSSTVDGTHLTTEGAREWKRRVETLCPQRKGAARANGRPLDGDGGMLNPA